MAAWKAGGILVSINPMSRTRELSYLLKDSGAKVLVALEGLYDEVARDVVPDTDVSLVLTTSELEYQSRNDPRLFADTERHRYDGTTDLLTLIDEHRGEVPPPVAPVAEDVAFLTYTSGTTGVPKGAMNTHGNVVFTSQVYRDCARFAPGGSIFGVAPLFHITGLIGHIGASFCGPTTLVLAYRFEPHVVLDALLEHRPTATIGAITAFSALLNSPDFTRDHFGSFTTIYSGGAAISPTAEKGFLAATGLQVHNAYGLTETTSPMTLTPFGAQSPVDPTSGALSVGVPGAQHDRADPGRARQRPAAGRDRRDRGRRPAGRRRLLGQARGDRGEPARWGPQERRRRVHEPRRLDLHRRPQEGHDQRLRLQGLAPRGRGRAGRARGGPRGGGGRRT